MSEPTGWSDETQARLERAVHEWAYANEHNNECPPDWEPLSCDAVASDIRAALAQIKRLTDKALRFDLDRLGIIQREREAVELVEGRAKLADTEAALRQASKMHGNALAEVERLRELIGGYFRVPSSEWIEALKAEARAALRGGGE